MPEKEICTICRKETDDFIYVDYKGEKKPVCKIHPSPKGIENIFKALGLKNSDELMTRSEIMYRISQIIKERNITQKEAGKLLGLKQERVSELMSRKLGLFSLEDLCKLLNTLERI